MEKRDRVVEEVKLAIKPFYSKGKITKDEYKDIMRRAVPKVCAMSILQTAGFSLSFAAATLLISPTRCRYVE